MASLVACKREKDVLCLMIGHFERFEDLYTISGQNQANQLIWFF